MTGRRPPQGARPANVPSASSVRQNRRRAAVAIVAALVPARAAALVDPLLVLRHE
jgi:hypothetical protein